MSAGQMNGIELRSQTLELGIRPREGLAASMQSASRWLGLGIAATAIAVLFGWAFDIGLLKSVFRGLPTMKPNTAAAFIASGAALLFRRPGGAGARLVSPLLAIVPVAIGLSTLLEFVSGRDFGIDQLLFRDLGAQVLNAGRMSPITASTFVAIGVALLMVDFKGPAQWLALLVGVCSLLATAGYLYGARVLYGFGLPAQPMALHTALLFFALCLGVLCARPERGPMRIVCADSATSRLLRRLLPAVIAIPLILGWLRLWGQRAGLYGTEFGLSLFAVANVTLLVGLLWWGAGSLFRSEAERARAEKDLRITQTRLSRLYESGVVSIFVADRDDRIVEANDSFLRLFGYARDDLRAGFVHWKDLTVRESWPREDARRRPAWESGAAAPVERACLRKDGTRVDVLAGVASLEDESAIAFLIDISERKRVATLEEQNLRIQQASRLKSEFLANMSHELRTPLNAILGFTQLVQEGSAGPVSPMQKEYLGDVLVSSRHLLQLINDILDLAKVESGKMEFHAEDADPARLVQEVCSVLRTTAMAKRIALTQNVDPSLSGLRLDVGKLKQVLYNYLSNALKFTPDGGHVEVCFKPEGEREFRLEVQDSGPGIPPGQVGRLFAEFEQLDSSFSKRHQGTGLGLSLVRRLVEAQGGRVGVQTAPGQGSLFFAVLPRVPSTGRARVPELRLTPGSRGGPRVLVIEDDSVNRSWISVTLTRAGYEVEAVATGEEAIRRCAVRRFDAITLDLLLPDLSGWDVLRALRMTGLNRDVPAVVITVVAERGSAAGFVVSDFLIKPVQPEQLLAALQRAGARPGGWTTVLVVDDDPTAFKLICPALEAQGYRTVCACDAEHGLQLAAEMRPGAVLLDLRMPGIDGLDFLRRLRAVPDSRETPVIAWSAKELSRDELAQLRGKTQGVVMKNPDSTGDLLYELRQHLPAARVPEARLPAPPP